MAAKLRDVSSGGNSSNGLIALGVILLVVAGFGLLVLVNTCMIEVPTGSMVVLTKKIGQDLPNDLELAPDESYKGVQLKVLTEGRHFLNPYVWDWEVIPQFVVPEGKVGIRVRLHGTDLPAGELVATTAEQKGIVAGYLLPGRYAINPFAERVELHEPIVIPAGHRGVVTNLAGPMSPNPNRLLVDPGERGVQEQTLDAGTHLYNPYEQRITVVDCRSQRYSLAEERDMGFPSKDGFWVSLDGVIEFRVKPEKAAEILVLYNQDFNGDRIDEEIRDKIILPNARSICRLQGSNSLGREFISGVNRSQFQEHFQTELRKACDPLGIEVVQALITRINPPQQIAEPVRQREIAVQQLKQFEQELLQQESEAKLATEQALIAQKQALVKAEQDVIRLTTEALQAQEVAVTKANENLAVAELKLAAARDEAEATLARGKAEAEVIGFQNEAEAAGWQRAVAAFGDDGNAYARYVLFEKLAPAYRQIMANTADSPIMDIFRAFTAPAASEGQAK